MTNAIIDRASVVECYLGFGFNERDMLRDLGEHESYDPLTVFEKIQIRLDAISNKINAMITPACISEARH